MEFGWYKNLDTNFTYFDMQKDNLCIKSVISIGRVSTIVNGNVKGLK